MVGKTNNNPRDKKVIGRINSPAAKEPSSDASTGDDKNNSDKENIINVFLILIDLIYLYII